MDFKILKELKPRCLYSVSSTQDYLAKLLRSLNEGDFVVSRIQTSGRGREGRRWQSDRGGLYLSITLTPGSDGFLNYLTEMLSKSVVQTLAKFDLECEIKLPNDVMVRGRKIAGVLADAELDGLATTVYCGIGVNLNNGEYWNEEMKQRATSFLLEKGKTIFEDDFLLELLRRIDEAYCLLIEDNKNQTKYSPACDFEMLGSKDLKK